MARTFGEIVRTQRSAEGLTAARLADLVGVPPSEVRSWERDHAAPADATTMAALAAVLGVAVAELEAALQPAPAESERVEASVEDRAEEPVEQDMEPVVEHPAEEDGAAAVRSIPAEQGPHPPDVEVRTLGSATSLEAVAERRPDTPAPEARTELLEAGPRVLGVGVSTEFDPDAVPPPPAPDAPALAEEPPPEEPFVEELPVEEPLVEELPVEEPLVEEADEPIPVLDVQPTSEPGPSPGPGVDAEPPASEAAVPEPPGVGARDVEPASAGFVPPVVSAEPDETAAAASAMATRPGVSTTRAITYTPSTQWTAQRPAPDEPESYLDDPEQIRWYRMRAFYTSAAIIVMLLFFGWAFGGFMSAAREVWDAFWSQLAF